jgi:hypothetical protein
MPSTATKANVPAPAATQIAILFPFGRLEPKGTGPGEG